jgi:UDP-N-acetylglucosamine acyltransferase
LAEVHPTAIVDPAAELASTVSIGPYCVVGGGVQLADNVRLLNHAVVGGATEIGEGTNVYPFASVGLPPQDRKYRGEPTRLVIGRNCVIREHATVNPGTAGGGGVTTIGDDCFLLVGCHVAHDCQIGNHVTLVNNATLGGHCRIDDHVTIGGLSAVHQFVRIGPYAFVGGMSAIENDVIPFGLALGNRAALGGLNVIGLTRHGFSREAIHTLRRAYRTLFGPDGTLKERLADVEAQFCEDANVQRIVAFIREGGERAICTPRRRDDGRDDI